MYHICFCLYIYIYIYVTNGLNCLKNARILFKIKTGQAGKATMETTPEMVDSVNLLILTDRRGIIEYISK